MCPLDVFGRNAAFVINKHGSFKLVLSFLFYRNVTIPESFFSVFLAVLVSFLGYFILTKGFLHDFWMFWFCFVMASSHYSLVKVSLDWIIFFFFFFSGERRGLEDGKLV